MQDTHNGSFMHRLVSNRSNNPIERQQLIIYLVAIGLAFVGLSLHLVGAVGSANPFLSGLSAIYITISLITFILWLMRRMRTSMALSVYGISAQSIQTVKVVFLVLVQPEAHNFFVIGNGIVSMSLIVLLSISYLRTPCIIAGAMDVVAIIFAAVMLDDNIATQYAVINTMFIVFFIIMTGMMTSNVKHLQEENTAYHRDENRLLQILRMNRKEIGAYIEMCRKENISDNDTDRLFSMLSDRSQRNVINAVERKKAIDASRTADLKSRFSSFTPMELEVTRLILRNFKLSQILEATGKNESNINSVRSHIRKKLGLAPGQDLREELLKALKQEQ